MFKVRNVALTLVFSAILALGAGFAGWADEIGDSVCKVLEANKDCVVSMDLVIQLDISFQGQTQQQEVKSTAVGVIIDPSGLIVTSLSAINPDANVNGAMPKNVEVKTKLIDATVKTADGTDCPVDVVLRDPDMDLAFLKPKQKCDIPFKALDLSQSAEPTLMQEVIVLNRLSQAANRAPIANINRVGAILNKPRVSYVLTDCGKLPGNPVFTSDGKCVGLLVNRKASGQNSRDIVMVVLPSSVVKDAAEKAKSAKAERAGKSENESPKK